jgi:ABC-type molybdate transport system substrate-binding protein
MELSETGPDPGLLVLAHEMGHVWQYQNGGLAYIPSSLIPQIVAGITGRSRNDAYNWKDAVRNNIDWADWNAEQQAECISDYNEALRNINAGTATLKDYETVSLAQRFIDFVRQRVGAVGSSRRSPDKAASPAGATP